MTYKNPYQSVSGRAQKANSYSNEHEKADMVTEGETAPDFTAPLAGGEAYNDIQPFTLSDALGDGPVVLAFYPAAFTSGCTEEMCTFRDSMHAFEKLDAQVYGISVDLPFAQNVWMQEHDLTVPMISDWDHNIIRQFDVVYADMYGMIETAQRSVFVLDADGVVVYRWVREGDNPNFEEFISDLHARIEAMVRS